MRCNQCDSLYINGVFCHETGCPNTHKIYDKEESEWVTPEPEEEFEEDEFTEEDVDGFYEGDFDRGGTGHGDISYSDADPGL